MYAPLKYKRIVIKTSKVFFIVKTKLKLDVLRPKAIYTKFRYK